MSQSLIKTERKPLREPEWIPAGTKVMIQLDKVESYSQGGIFIPTKISDRDNMNQTEGTVAALGPLAYKDMRAWDTDSQRWIQVPLVKVGDRVKFQRHHGWVHMEGEGSESTEYRVMHDTDLTMVQANQSVGDNHE